MGSNVDSNVGSVGHDRRSLGRVRKICPSWSGSNCGGDLPLMNASVAFAQLTSNKVDSSVGSGVGGVSHSRGSLEREGQAIQAGVGAIVIVTSLR